MIFPTLTVLKSCSNPIPFARQSGVCPASLRVKCVAKWNVTGISGTSGIGIHRYLRVVCGRFTQRSPRGGSLIRNPAVSRRFPDFSNFLRTDLQIHCAPARIPLVELSRVLVPFTIGTVGASPFVKWRGCMDTRIGFDFTKRSGMALGKSATRYRPPLHVPSRVK